MVTPANGASALVAQPQITTSQSVEPALDLEAGSVSSTAPATLGAAVPTPGLSRTTATLSQPREGMTATTVGTKAIFAGGWTESGPSSVVDIYDTSTGKWSAAKLSQARYYGMVAATVGTQAIFAGGVTGNSDGRLVESSVVDIYDASTGAWSTATLSQARDSIAATTVGTNVIFAGGSTGNSESNVVDIYDASTGAWSTATLSQARDGIAATTVGTKAVFAAGFSGSEASDPSNVVDIYDASTGAWSTAKLSQARGYLAVTTVGTKAIFAGGVTGNSSHVVESNVVDVYDGSTGQWSTTTLSQARDHLAATTVGAKAIFAGGWNGSSESRVVDLLAFPPSVTVTTPSSPQSGNVTIAYSLIDAVSDTCSIAVQYSPNGGRTWKAATAASGGEGLTGLTSSPTGTPHTFVWASGGDIVSANSSGVEFRITPTDSVAKTVGSPGTTAGFVVNNKVNRPGATATTLAVSADPSGFGQPVAFTATVKSKPGTASTNSFTVDGALRALLLDESTATGKLRPLFEP